jgi:hypothetical protein
MSKDQHHCFLDLFEIGSSQELVKRKVLHKDIVLVYCKSVTFETLAAYQYR